VYKRTLDALSESNSELSPSPSIDMIDESSSSHDHHHKGIGGEKEKLVDRLISPVDLKKEKQREKEKTFEPLFTPYEKEGRGKEKEQLGHNSPAKTKHTHKKA